MLYTDPNEYQRRTFMLEEVMRLHPSVMKAVTDADKELLERYFLQAAKAEDPGEYQRNLIKSDPNVEIRANKAFERFMAEAGMSEMLLPSR